MIQQPLPQRIYALLPYAEQEGWNLFWRFATGWTIEHVQEPEDGLPEIPGKHAAWEHAWRRACDGGFTLEILEYLRLNNEGEYRRIAQHCCSLRSRRPQP